MPEPDLRAEVLAALDRKSHEITSLSLYADDLPPLAKDTLTALRHLRANDDQILAQMRYSQAESQLPQEVRNYGVTVKKATTSPLALFSLYSPNETYDNIWLANYAFININDPMSRVPGIGQVTIFGAGQYAMRFWVRPDVLATLGITVPEILDAVKKQNTVNPAGQVGAEPIPAGQEFRHALDKAGRITLGNASTADVSIAGARRDLAAVTNNDVARFSIGADGRPVAVAP